MRKFIFLLLAHSLMWQVTATATPTPTEDYLRFGPKIGYHGFLWELGRHWIKREYYSSGWPVGLFLSHFSKTNDARPNDGWEIGCFFHVTHINADKHEIDPKRLLEYDIDRKTPLYVKSIHIPITEKMYVGQRRRFCWLFGFDISYILTAKISDPGGILFTKSFNNTALDTNNKIKKIPPGYRTDYTYTHIPVQTIFGRRWHFGIGAGIGYEMEMGLDFHFNIMATETFRTLGFIFTIGYDVNKFLIPAIKDEKKCGNPKENTNTIPILEQSDL